MTATLIIVGVIILLVYLNASGQIEEQIKEDRKRAQALRNEIRYQGLETDYVYDDFRTYIAGVNFNCGKKDIGGYLGFATPVYNPHDKNAVAIYRSDGKMLGYIPKKEAKEFRKWSGGGIVPCIGFIKRGDDGMLNGRIKAIAPENEFAVCRTLESYASWIAGEFGTKFLTKHIIGENIDTDLKSVDEKVTAAVERFIIGYRQPFADKPTEQERNISEGTRDVGEAAGKDSECKSDEKGNAAVVDNRFNEAWNSIAYTYENTGNLKFYTHEEMPGKVLGKKGTQRRLRHDEIVNMILAEQSADAAEKGEKLSGKSENQNNPNKL